MEDEEVEFLIGTGTFIAIYFALEGFYLLLEGLKNREKRAVQKRLRILSSKEYENESVDILRRNLLSEMEWFNQLLASFRWSERINRFLQQADARYTLGVYVLLSLLLACTASLVLSSVNAGALLSGLLAMVLGISPFLALNAKRKKRLEKFQRQLPEAMDLVARALKAGHAFTIGLKMVADELDDPISAEFEKTLQEINFGLAAPEALKNLSSRIDCPDLRFFVISVILQRETGGNLAEILEKIAQLIRERFRLQGRVRALSAEGRLSAIILVSLPFMVAFILFLLNPGYLRTLFADPMGKTLTSVSLLLMAFGIFIMKRMIAIRV